MKQLKVIEMIAKIEEKTDKKNKEEVKERDEVKERRSPAATPRNFTSTVNKTDGSNLNDKHKNYRDLVIGIGNEEDGGQIDLRTSLNKRAGSVMKNKLDLQGKKGARKGTIQELIGRFNGGGDGKKPLDGTDDESESSERNMIIDLGLGIR